MKTTRFSNSFVTYGLRNYQTAQLQTLIVLMLLISVFFMFLCVFCVTVFFDLCFCRVFCNCVGFIFICVFFSTEL